MTWDELCRAAEQHGFKRAGFGSRLEGHDVHLHNRCGKAHLTSNTFPSLTVWMFYQEAADWIARTSWE